MSCASSWALVCESLMIRLRVRNIRPHEATPTVTATLTAISQILVRIVTSALIYRETSGTGRSAWEVRTRARRGWRWRRLQRRAAGGIGRDAAHELASIGGRL